MSNTRAALQPLPPGAAPRFALGSVVFTPAALDILMELDIDHYALLKRHISCCATDCSADDQAENVLAAEQGDARIFSTFIVAQDEQQEPIKLWIITEADRSATTILTPDCY